MHMATQHFLVEVELPPGASSEEFIEHLRDAHRAHATRHLPHDPLRGIGPIDVSLEVAKTFGDVVVALPAAS